MNETAVDALTILLVDDDAVLLRGTGRVLERDGYRILLAQSGQEALDLMRACPPQLVLLDWNMPGMDGLEVCRRIKADPACAEVLVIVVSGTYAQSEE